MKIVNNYYLNCYLDSDCAPSRCPPCKGNCIRPIADWFLVDMLGFAVLGYALLGGILSGEMGQEFQYDLQIKSIK